MGAGVWNLVLGVVFIVGGASGRMVLIGTHSSEALLVAGVAMAGWGAYQMYRARRQQ
ncbi:MAG: hypothetical protein AB2A00_17720 [Myxococcota bacterium]